MTAGNVWGAYWPHVEASWTCHGSSLELFGAVFEAFLERVESVKGRLEALLSRRLIVCDTPYKVKMQVGR